MRPMSLHNPRETPMAFQATNWALAQVCDTPSERAVLFYLAHCVNWRGVEPICFPGQDRIAAAACISDRHVRRLLRSLAHKGLISWKARGRRGRTGRSSNVYRLHIDDWTPHYQPPNQDDFRKKQEKQNTRESQKSESGGSHKAGLLNRGIPSWLQEPGVPS